MTFAVGSKVRIIAVSASNPRHERWHSVEEIIGQTRYIARYDASDDTYSVSHSAGGHHSLWVPGRYLEAVADFKEGQLVMTIANTRSASDHINGAKRRITKVDTRDNTLLLDNDGTHQWYNFADVRKVEDSPRVAPKLDDTFVVRESHTLTGMACHTVGEVVKVVEVLSPTRVRAIGEGPKFSRSWYYDIEALVPAVVAKPKVQIEQRAGVFLVPTTATVEVPKAVGELLKAWIASAPDKGPAVTQIKAVRSALGLGLKEAKDIVEAFRNA